MTTPNETICIFNELYRADTIWGQNDAQMIFLDLWFLLNAAMNIT